MGSRRHKGSNLVCAKQSIDLSCAKTHCWEGEKKKVRLRRLASMTNKETGYLTGPPQSTSKNQWMKFKEYQILVSVMQDTNQEYKWLGDCQIPKG